MFSVLVMNDLYGDNLAVGTDLDADGLLVDLHFFPPLHTIVDLGFGDGPTIRAAVVGRTFRDGVELVRLRFIAEAEAPHGAHAH